MERQGSLFALRCREKPSTSQFLYPEANAAAKKYTLMLGETE